MKALEKIFNTKITVRQGETVRPVISISGINPETGEPFGSIDTEIFVTTDRGRHITLLSLCFPFGGGYNAGSPTLEAVSSNFERLVEAQAGFDCHAKKYYTPKPDCYGYDGDNEFVFE